jgi:hypothetical protein
MALVAAPLEPNRELDEKTLNSLLQGAAASLLGCRAEDPRHEQGVAHPRVQHRRAGEEPVGESLVNEKKPDLVAGFLIGLR